LFLSKHLKYMSLASQHFARADRSGAIGVPSVEIFGAGNLSAELENKPMAYVYLEKWKLFVGVAMSRRNSLFSLLSAYIFTLFRRYGVVQISR
jgi:hypothetical protein